MQRLLPEGMGTSKLLQRGLMPRFRCTLWIQDTGGGSAHVSCGVQKALPANQQRMYLPVSDLTSLGVSWHPPLWSRHDLNLRHACQPQGGRRRMVLAPRAYRALLRALKNFELSEATEIIGRASIAHDYILERSLVAFALCIMAESLPGQQRDRLCSVRVGCSKSCFESELLLHLGQAFLLP
jgi:hypothetical protein